MYEIELKYLGAVVISLAVFARPYILKKVRQEGAVGNIVFLILLISAVTPLFIYKLTFFSLDDSSAEKLVDKTLEDELFKGFSDPSHITWKSDGKEKNGYIITADVRNGGQSYRLYMQPECRLFEGCEVTVDRIMILPETKPLPRIEEVDTEFFEKRACDDALVLNLLRRDRIENAFAILFENYGKIPGIDATYAIDTIKISDISETATSQSGMEHNGSLSNSCVATFETRGSFSVAKEGHEYAQVVLEMLFDGVRQTAKGYNLRSEIRYDILVSDMHEVSLAAQPFDVERLKRFISRAKRSADAAGANNDSRPVSYTAVGSSQLQGMRSQCSFSDVFLPENLAVYAAGAYKGRETDWQIDDSGHQATQFDIVVNSPERPVALILGAYEPSVWNIGWTEGTRIVAVYTSGNHRQGVAGVAWDTPMLISSNENGAPCGYMYVDEQHLEKLNPLSKRLFGKEVDMVYYAKSGKALIGDALAPNAMLYTYNDITPESFVDKNRPLAGPAGLRDAVAKGILRPVRTEDIKRWKRLQLQQKGTELPPVASDGERPPSYEPHVQNGYVILKAFDIPAGLYGGHLATFFLLEGVPQPKGNLGHSTLYDFNTMTCRGTMCGMQ